MRYISIIILCTYLLEEMPKFCLFCFCHYMNTDLQLKEAQFTKRTKLRKAVLIPWPVHPSASLLCLPSLLWFFSIKLHVCFIFRMASRAPAANDDSDDDVVVVTPPASLSGKRSAVWAYFTPDDSKSNWVNCDLCHIKKRIKVADSSTSNLWSHLRAYHPTEYATSENKKIPSAQASNATKAGLRDHSQPKITTSFQQNTPFSYDSKEWKTVTDKLSVMVAKLMLPFSIVDGPEFVEFVKSLNARYKVPSRKYISDTAIPKKYNEMKAKVISDLKTSDSISLTTDAWSSNTMDSYLSLTAHFITPSWKLQTYCLRTIYMPESHTGENLAAMIRNILKEYDVTLDRVVSITTDSGRNMVKACDELTPIVRVPCFGHILHNSVNNATKDENIAGTLKSVRSIVTTFSHSGKWVTLICTYSFIADMMW